MTDSRRLLADYVGTGSDAAFRELVSRYVDLVYSAALRLVDGDRHRAEDVTQTVFVDLSRLARTLPTEVMLGGWLHRHTCFVAANTMRGERRRQSRERQAVEMNTLQDNSPQDFSLVAPMLDEAINELGEADRAAILLRFFEQRDFRSVGTALGSNEDAARMRVNRALEKLQSLLKRRGVTTSGAAFALALSANAIQAAPVALVAAISASAALTGTAAATTVTATATKAIAMTTLQKTVIGATLVACVATPFVVQHQKQAKLSDENQALQQRIDQQAQQLIESKRLAAQTKEANDLSEEQFSELLRLRSEVGRLRRQTEELTRLRNENERLLASVAINQTVRSGPPGSTPGSNEVASATAVIFDPATGIREKLEALRILRSANARSDDVVRRMVQAYYSTDNPEWRADIFRQLSGVTTPELKRPLLESVSNPNDYIIVREEAAETLADYLPDPDVKAWLDHLAANEPQADVRAEARRSLEAFQHRKRQ